MTKTEYYLRIARTVAEKSTCLKKQYGAIIINNDTCRKEPHCTTCTKPSGNGDMEEYKKCPAVHAEMNCIISASRKEMLGADLYLAGWEVINDPDCTKQEMHDPRPCEICLRLIKNAGINRIINRTGIIYERMDDGIMHCLKESHD